MPRFEGDFRFCCTAMTIAPCFSMTLSFQRGQLFESRARRPARRRAFGLAARSLLVPRRVRQSEDDLILDQAADVELAARLDSLRFLVLQLDGAMPRQQQRVGYPQRVLQQAQATLAPQVQHAPDLEDKDWPAAGVQRASHFEADLARIVVQAVPEPREPRNGQAAAQELSGPGEFQTVDHSLLRHRPRMIVFLLISVKEKSRFGRDLA